MFPFLLKSLYNVQYLVLVPCPPLFFSNVAFSAQPHAAGGDEHTPAEDQQMQQPASDAAGSEEGDPPGAPPVLGHVVPVAAAEVEIVNTTQGDPPLHLPEVAPEDDPLTRAQQDAENARRIMSKIYEIVSRKFDDGDTPATPPPASQEQSELEDQGQSQPQDTLQESQHCDGAADTEEKEDNGDSEEGDENANESEEGDNNGNDSEEGDENANESEEGDNNGNESQDEQDADDDSEDSEQDEAGEGAETMETCVDSLVVPDTPPKPKRVSPTFPGRRTKSGRPVKTTIRFSPL